MAGIKKYKNKIAAGLFAFAAVFSAAAYMLSFAASAAAQSGSYEDASITLNLEYADEAVIGGTFALYRVGDYDDSGLCFVLTDDFAGYSGAKEYTQSEAMTEESALALSSYIVSNGITADKILRNRTGTVTFGGLSEGLYLIRNIKAADGFLEISSFLISIPMLSDGVYIYNVNAYGKFELEKKETEISTEEETTKPSDDETDEDEPSETTPSDDTPSGDIPEEETPDVGQRFWEPAALLGAGTLLWALLLKKSDRGSWLM